MLCSHCGAPYTPGVNAACRECRLALNERAEPTLPDDDDGPDEVGFDLAEWPPEARVNLGATLAGDDVPFRWEPGPMLVVREFDEDVVEELLDSVAGEDAGGWSDVEDSEEEEDSDEDDDDAATVMGDLFDVADRLTHAPWNREFIDEVRALVTVVEASEPPFGIVPEMWDQIADLASAVVTGAEDQDDVAVEDAAKALRSYLREYV